MCFTNSASGIVSGASIRATSMGRNENGRDEKCSHAYRSLTAEHLEYQVYPLVSSTKAECFLPKIHSSDNTG